MLPCCHEPASETTQTHEIGHADLAWRVLGLLNLYRLLAVLVLVAMYLLRSRPPAFGNAAPQLFRVALITYFLLARAARARRPAPLAESPRAGADACA